MLEELARIASRTAGMSVVVIVLAHNPMLQKDKPWCHYTLVSNNLCGAAKQRVNLLPVFI